MKKTFVLVLILSLLLGISAFAEADITVLVENSPVYFDAKPVIQNDRTLVPIRAIAESLDCNVLWDDANRIVTIEQSTLEGTKLLFLPIDNTEGTAYHVIENEEGDAKTEESVISLDVPAQIIDDRTYLPLRFVSEYLNCTVAWDDVTRTVTVTPQSHPFGALYYKANDGNKRRVLVGGLDVAQKVEIINGRVYYLTKYGDFFSQNLDGSGKKCYSNLNVTQFEIYQDKVYYIDDTVLYMMDLDGSNLKQIAAVALDFIINPTGILYRSRTSQEGVELGIVKLDGTPIGTPTRKDTVSSFWGNTIYYTKPYIEGFMSVKMALMKEDLDGKEGKTIATVQSNSVGFGSDKIYYLGEDGACYGVGYDGAAPEKLSDEPLQYQTENDEYVVLANGSVFYRFTKATGDLEKIGEMDFIACKLINNTLYCINSSLEANSLQLLTGEIGTVDSGVLQIVNADDEGVYYTVMPH